MICLDLRCKGNEDVTPIFGKPNWQVRGLFTVKLLCSGPDSSMYYSVINTFGKLFGLYELQFYHLKHDNHDFYKVLRRAFVVTVQQMLAITIRGVIMNHMLKLNWNKAGVNIKQKEDCLVEAIFLPLTLFDSQRLKFKTLSHLFSYNIKI